MKKGWDETVAQQNRRRQLLIHDVQYRLLTVNLAYFTAILFVFALVLFAPLAYQLSQADLSLAAREEIAQQFLLLNERIWPALLIAFLCLAAHSIYMSHRIGGPLYQFRKVLKRLGTGDLTVGVKLRKGDYLRGEAEAINELRDALGASLRETQVQLLELCAELNELKASARDGTSSNPEEALASLEDRVVVLQHTLTKFRTTPEPGGPRLTLVDGENEPPSVPVPFPSRSIM